MGEPPSSTERCRERTIVLSVEETYFGAAGGAKGTVAAVMYSIGDHSPGPLTFTALYLNPYVAPRVRPDTV